jgi:hypothetical protein
MHRPARRRDDSVRLINLIPHVRFRKTDACSANAQSPARDLIVSPKPFPVAN